MLAFDNPKLRHFSIKTITVSLVQFEIFKFADIYIYIYFTFDVSTIKL